MKHDEVESNGLHQLISVVRGIWKQKNNIIIFFTQKFQNKEEWISQKWPILGLATSNIELYNITFEL